MKFKNKKIVFIGDDGKPEVNDDGTFKTQTLYRGFLTKESYNASITEKNKNLIQREKQALETLELKQKEFDDYKNSQKVDEIFTKIGIKKSFATLIKDKVNINNPPELMEQEVKNLIKQFPEIKETVSTGGLPKNNPPEIKETKPNLKIIG